MDKKFLEDYQERELSLIKMPSNERYPDLQTPVFNPPRNGKMLWSQVALSGTTLFPLYAWPLEQFENLWNISKNDIPDLITFAKDTKKILFYLTDRPTYYEQYDYLEPILRELSPPILHDSFKESELKDINDIYNSSMEEIGVLAVISPFWQNYCSEIGGQRTLNNNIASYARFRYYGFNDIADTYINNFLIDPEFALVYMNMFVNLVLNPIRDPFNANISIDTDFINKAKKYGISLDVSSDKSINEIGSFLMKKCTCYPESLEACKNLISQYKDNDLYKVNNSLHHAIVDRNESKIIKDKNELSQILDNVWDDNKIKHRATAINLGTDIIFGAIGCCVANVPGLLGSILLKTADRGQTHFIDQFSELIAKKMAKPYMATIFDFKKKYNLDK